MNIYYLLHSHTRYIYAYTICMSSQYSQCQRLPQCSDMHMYRANKCKSLNTQVGLRTSLRDYNILLKSSFSCETLPNLIYNSISRQTTLLLHLYYTLQLAPPLSNASPALYNISPSYRNRPLSYEVTPSCFCSSLFLCVVYFASRE